jgi:hypothetical protein
MGKNRIFLSYNRIHKLQAHVLMFQIKKNRKNLVYRVRLSDYLNQKSLKKDEGKSEHKKGRAKLTAEFSERREGRWRPPAFTIAGRRDQDQLRSALEENQRKERRQKPTKSYLKYLGAIPSVKIKNIQK